jgi:hypothetical protein
MTPLRQKTRQALIFFWGGLKDPGQCSSPIIGLLNYVFFKTIEVASAYKLQHQK